MNESREPAPRSKIEDLPSSRKIGEIASQRLKNWTHPIYETELAIQEQQRVSVAREHVMHPDTVVSVEALHDADGNVIGEKKTYTRDVPIKIESTATVHVNVDHMPKH